MGVLERAGLEGRRALVTGGAGHVGRAVGQALAGLGARVVLLDRDGAALQDALAGLSPEDRFEAVETDLEDEPRLRADLRRLLQADARLDIVVHAAALVGTTPLPGWSTPFAQQSTQTWRRALEVNLTSLFAIVQECLPSLQASGKGSIVAVGSIYGHVGPDWSLYKDTPLGNPAAYAASKGGLNQFTRWLATTLAPRVRANVVSPAGIRRGQPPAFEARAVARTPLGRLATEQDVADAVAFLAGDLSSYVTGQDLVVDGGWTAW